MSKKNSKQPEHLEEERRKAELIQMKKNDPAIIKEEIFLLKEQFEDIMKKKYQMESQITVLQQQNSKETYELEKQLKMEQQICVDCESQLGEFKKKADSQLKALKSSKMIEIQEFSKKKNQEKQQISKQRRLLEEKLQYLKQYPQRQKKYAQVVAELDEKSSKMLKDQQKDIKNIRNQHQQKRNQNQNLTKEQMEKIKIAQKNRLEKKMTRDQYIKRQNEVIQKEIQLCQQQKSALEIQCREMNNQMELDKEKNNHENALGNQAGQTYERSLRIIKLEGKLSKLKSYLTEETNKMQKEYDQLDNVYAKQFQELEGKISKVEGWIRMKERDLKKVKACSQMVLNQRSNLQSYLLEVFYEHPEIDYKNPSQISQILRYLFAKINSKKPPVTYKNYLPNQDSSLSSSITKI